MMHMMRSGPFSTLLDPILPYPTLSYPIQGPSRVKTRLKPSVARRCSAALSGLRFFRTYAAHVRHLTAGRYR